MIQFVSTMTALVVWSVPQVALVLPCILLYLQLMRTHNTRPQFGGLNVTKEKVRLFPLSCFTTDRSLINYHGAFFSFDGGGPT